jgi:Tol biopolymer transport system component
VVLADRVNGQVTRLGGVLGWESLFLDWEPGNPPRLVVRAEPTGAGGVYRVDPRTLEAEHLPVPEETYNVAFSPDGERVLFAVTEGLGHGSELWMMNRDGSSLTRLVSEQRHILALPRWSPDGKRWAYIRMPDSEVPFPVGELWVMDGKNARLLSDWADAGRGYGPVWSPDGQTVAFVARENVADRLADLLLSRLESNLYLADIATGRVQAVTRFENAWIEEPVWSPDGHQLIFHGIIGARPGIWQVHLASRRFSLLIPDDARAIVWIPEIPNQ